jgi:hypothetical protein
MNPQIRHAQRACEAAKARQAIVVWFDEHGQFAVASYGETKAECSAVKPVCIAIADMFDSGYLEGPGTESGGDERPDHRRGDLGGWNEYDRLRNERELAVARAQAVEAKLAAIATLVSIYDTQDEPEGQVSARRALMAIGETIGQPCSICRRRHGQEVEHACE